MDNTIAGLIDLEMAKRKAQNYANYLNEPMHIFVYNDKDPGMEGHHLVDQDELKVLHDKYEELDFVETIEPNGAEVIYSD